MCFVFKWINLIASTRRWRRRSADFAKLQDLNFRLWRCWPSTGTARLSAVAASVTFSRFSRFRFSSPELQAPNRRVKQFAKQSGNQVERSHTVFCSIWERKALFGDQKFSVNFTLTEGLRLRGEEAEEEGSTGLQTCAVDFFLAIV